MSPKSIKVDSPFAVTLIALFQGSMASYLLYFVIVACVNPAEGLGQLRSALRLLIGRTDYRSYSNSAHEVLTTDLFFFSLGAVTVALYALITGWGLWRLKKWARHSVISVCGTEMIFWLRGFLYFGIARGFSQTPQSALQPVYIVMFVETLILLTLIFYGGVSQSFGEVE